MKYILSLGSNLGRDRKKNLLTALGHLKNLGQLGKVSGIYETEPVNMGTDAGPFLNLVLELESTLAPRQLLDKLKKIELIMGRDLADSHNRPRIIDLDILFAENMVIDAPGLKIPQANLEKRAYVLIPLLEIVPRIIHPEIKVTIRELAQNLGNTAGRVKYYDKTILK